MTTKLFSPKRFFVLALVTAGTSMAATKICYDEIPKHLGPFGNLLEHRGFTVTTTDGKLHKGRGLEIYSDHLSIYRGKSHEDLPKSEVTRIEISQAGRFFHHVVDNSLAWALVTDDEDVTSIGGFLMLPPVLAYTAATTPFFLAADGIAFLIPPKVYEIVHERDRIIP
jgi:hypothetical protein